jgi:hypothetical protein
MSYEPPLNDTDFEDEEEIDEEFEEMLEEALER